MKTIIEMAREAGIADAHSNTPHKGVMAQLERFAELVRADEREACALVSEDCGAIHVAKRIRARGNA